MFEFCKKVTIYNIQNHHHYYSNQSQSNSSQLKKKSWKQLKVSPLHINPIKKNVKGISLSISNPPEQKKSSPKTLFKYKRTEPSTVTNFVDHESSKNIDINQSILKTDLSEQINYKSLQQLLNYKHQKSKTETGNGQRIQNIHKKNKPLYPSIQFNKKQQMSMKQIPLKKISSTMMETNLTHKNQSLRQPDEKKTEKEHISRKSFPSESGSIYLKSSSISKKSEENSFRNQSKKFIKSVYSSHHESLLKVSDMAQASVMLSQILHRESIPSKNEVVDQGNKKQFRLGLWPIDNDRVTIKSNYESEQKSFRVQESQIFQHQSKSNFVLLPFQDIGSNLRLAVEKTNNCLVSLKQVSFQEMGLVSLEIQIYEMVKIQLEGKDPYKNILQLYQTLLSGGSYILIKQPYLKTLLSQELQKQQIEELIQTVEQVLDTFEKAKIYPSRHLKLQDFVECLGIYKIHDLSAFGNQKQLYTRQQVVQKFKNSLSLQSSKRTFK